MKRQKLLILLAIAFTGTVARTPLTPVGVLEEPIRTTTGLSYGAVGLLTTIPVVIFALTALPLGELRRRLGLPGAMALGMGCLLAGVLLRSWGGPAGLFLGTAVLGIGISSANVLVSVAVKEHFPDRTGQVTGLYTTCMYLATAAAAATALPVYRRTGSWRMTLCLWLPGGVLALIAWLLASRGETGRTVPPPVRMGGLLRDPMAWWVTVLMGSQSVIFYSLAAWFPAILSVRGLSPAVAGNFTSLMQAGGILGAVITAAAVSKRKDQRGFCVLVGLLFLGGLAMLAFARGSLTLTLTAVVLGFCCCASVSAAYCVISLRAATPEIAAGLSGMSQTFGYVVAAVGPVLGGRLFDLTGSWLLPLSLWAVCAAVYAAAGLKVGRADLTIFGERD